MWVNKTVGFANPKLWKKRTNILLINELIRVNARKKNCTRLKQIKLVFNFVN